MVQKIKGLFLSKLNYQYIPFYFLCQDQHKNDCWVFDADDNAWSLYSTGSYGHQDYPGTAHMNKIYIAGPTHPEIFDPTTNEWSLCQNRMLQMVITAAFYPGKIH